MPNPSPKGLPKFCRFASLVNYSGVMRILTVAGVVAFLTAGCAKTGDPQPPEVHIPKASMDLTARQRADQVVLAVTRPTVNADGSAADTLAEVDVFRAVESDRHKAQTLSEDQFTRQSERILAIKADLFQNHLQGGMFVFVDPLLLADRNEIYADGFRYAVRFLNKKRQSAGFSNQAFIAPIPMPGPPTQLTYELKQDLIRLTWTPPNANVDGSRPARILGYNVYRSEDPQKFSSAPANKELLKTPEYEDRNFEFDKTYYYEVGLVGSLVNPYAESMPSEPLSVATRDVFPPGPPRYLNAVVEKGTAVLLWSAPEDRDVSGYRIYRQEKGGPDRVLLQSGLIVDLSYRDNKVQPGKVYEYSVTAVDTHGNEGSPAQSTVEIP